MANHIEGMAVLFSINKNPEKALQFKNGVVIPTKLPAAQDIKGLDLKKVSLQEVCPIREICMDGNCADCEIYSMFSGAYIYT